MADLVLVQPRIGHWDSVRSSPEAPLGLLSAARLAHERFSIRLIDARTEPRWREDLRDAVRRDPVCVATTAMTGHQIAHALEASRVAKEAGDAPVVWGGVHASLLPDQTLAHPDVDAVVRGEGDVALDELAQALESGGPLERVRGVSFKRAGRAVHAPDRPLADLDALPDLPYHLADMRRYMVVRNGRRTLNLESSRGCPHRCGFCYNVAYNRGTWRALSAERTVEAAGRLAELGAEGVFFVDDNLLVDVGRVEAIARGVSKLGLTWGAQGVRVDDAGALGLPRLELLARHGCRQLYLGVESGSQRLLDLMAKGITVEQVRAVNRALAKVPVLAEYQFITGLPTETEEDLAATRSLALALLDDNPNARVVALKCYSPYPGTALYDEAVRAGFVAPEGLDGWARFTWETTGLPWLTPLQRRRLETLYIASLFMDPKSRDLAASPLVRAFGELYRPLARRRVRTGFLDLPLENLLMRAAARD